MKEESKINNKNTFKFCDKDFKTIREDILCSQDDLHKSMQDNSVGFIIFYVFAILFVALLFSYLREVSQIRIKKINNLALFLSILLFLHFLLILALAMISEIFQLQGMFIQKILRDKKNCVLFLLIFSISFIFLSVLILTIMV